jgi:hypothetical protein
MTRPHYQTGVRGFKVTYPVPTTQTEELGLILMQHGREIEWEITPKSGDIEMLHLVATLSIHHEIFRAAYLSEQARRRIGKIIGV